MSDEGGSRTDWKLASRSAFRNSGHVHVQNNPLTDVYVATAAKLTGGVGSMVFYLGGHNYSGTSLGQLNGQRMYLNAVLTYSGRPTSCGLYFSDNMVVASISSAADQIFLGGDPPTAISPITVTDDETTPTIHGRQRHPHPHPQRLQHGLGHHRHHGGRHGFGGRQGLPHGELRRRRQDPGDQCHLEFCGLRSDHHLRVEL